MRIVYLHDGTFEGLLHAVATAVKSGGDVKGIYDKKRYSPSLFDVCKPLKTDGDQVQRLFDYLKGLGNGPLRFAMDGYLSDDVEIGIHLYEMVRLCLVHGGRAGQLYTNDSIKYLDDLSKKVRFEAHRLTGLIRFRIFNDGLQYAPFEPDCIVIGYLARHFRERLKNRRWILHDIRRNLALYWDGESLQPIDIEKDFTDYVRKFGEVSEEKLSEDEVYYQQLWTSFHSAIANASRENIKLQRQFMPQRYWKYLVEMKP